MTGGGQRKALRTQHCQEVDLAFLDPFVLVGREFGVCTIFTVNKEDGNKQIPTSLQGNNAAKTSEAHVRQHGWVFSSKDRLPMHCAGAPAAGVINSISLEWMTAASSSRVVKIIHYHDCPAS